MLFCPPSSIPGNWTGEGLGQTERSRKRWNQVSEAGSGPVVGEDGGTQPQGKTGIGLEPLTAHFAPFLATPRPFVLMSPFPMSLPLKEADPGRSFHDGTLGVD